MLPVARHQTGTMADPASSQTGVVSTTVVDPALVTPRGEVLAHELLRNVASASQSLSDSLRSLRGVSPHILDSSSGGLVRDLSLTLATVSMGACSSGWCVHLSP